MYIHTCVHTSPVGPEDSCLGKSEDTPVNEQGSGDKTTVSTGDTACDVTCSVSDTVTEVDTNLSSHRAAVNGIPGPSVACAVSDVIADAPGEDRTTSSTPSDTVSDMSSDLSKDNPSSYETEGDTINNKLEGTHRDEISSDIHDVTPCDKIINTEGKVDTTSDKGAVIKSDTLSDDVTPETQPNHQKQCAIESEGLHQNDGTSNDRPLDIEVSTLSGTKDDKPSDQRTDTSANDTCNTTDMESNSTSSATTHVKFEKKVEGNDAPTGEAVSTNSDIPNEKNENVDGDHKMCVEHSTLVNDGAHWPRIEDLSSDKRTDTEGDKSSDKRTNVEGDMTGDKRTDTESDAMGDKRNDTQGDTSRDKRTDIGEDVTDKETRSIGTTTKEETISNNKIIIQEYKERMKQNRSGHKLKFLRPELVKAFIQ